MTVVRNFKSY